MNSNTPDQAELKDIYEVFAGKTMLQNIRDTVARACTGYDYENLKQEVINPDNDGALEIDEIEEVDKTVTLLLHLFKYHLAQQPSSQAIERANIEARIDEANCAMGEFRIETKDTLYFYSKAERLAQLKADLARLSTPNETGRKA